jgi:hypothetical protein
MLVPTRKCNQRRKKGQEQVNTIFEVCADILRQTIFRRYTTDQLMEQRCYDPGLRGGPRRRLLADPYSASKSRKVDFNLPVA